MPCQYSQRLFFGSRIYTASGKLSLWGMRCGGKGGLVQHLVSATVRMSFEEAATTIVVVSRKWKHISVMGWRILIKYINIIHIFTCILLICQHYKLSGRTRKYEKWTSCRAISGRAMLSAYRCGLSMGTVPNTKTTVDCGPKSPVPTPDESLNYYDWLLLHGIAIYFT